METQSLQLHHYLHVLILLLPLGFHHLPPLPKSKDSHLLPEEFQGCYIIFIWFMGCVVAEDPA